MKACTSSSAYVAYRRTLGLLSRTSAVSVRIASDRHSSYRPRIGSRRSRTTEPCGVRKALTRTELSRTTLGMFGAHRACLLSGYIHDLVLGRRRRADVRHPAQDG